MLNEINELINLVQEYSKENYPNYKIYSILLYGGACKYHFGLKDSFGDYDLNLFLVSKQMQEHISTRGFPKRIGKFREKKIEVMRNLIVKDNEQFDEQELINFMKKQKSKRWHDNKRGILHNPALIVYPISKKIF